LEISFSGDVSQHVEQTSLKFKIVW